MACKNHPDRDAVGACAACGVELCAECVQTGSDGKSYCAADLPAAAPAAPAPAPPAPVPAPVVSAAPAPVAPPPPVGAPAQSGSIVLAAIGYLVWPCGLIAALIEKTDKQVKFHGWNSFFFFLAYLAAEIAVGILAHMPGVGRAFRHLYSPVYLLYVVLGIIFLVNALGRKPVNIPVISDLARKQAGL